MASETPWKWTRRFAVGLTLSVAGFSAFGALAPHIPMWQWLPPLAAGMLLAAFYGNAQGLANCMAANTRAAWDRGRDYRTPAIFFFICFVGFALLSMSGLHAAWEYVKENSAGSPLPNDGLMKLLFWFVAFSEPAMNYGIQALKALHKAEEREDDKAWRDAAADREARLYGTPEQRRGSMSVIAGGAAAAAALSMAAPVEQAHAFPTEMHDPSGTEEVAHQAHGWTGPRDESRWNRFREARELGLKPKEIIAETGIPSTTVYRWWNLLEAQAAA